MKDADKIALAGLLHDIGKFAQRADEKTNLDDYDFNFSVCSKNKCSYYHAGYTAKVLKEIGLDNIKDLVNIASSHHKHNLEGLERIIQLADRYASAERKEGESSDFRDTKLMSIFSEVSLSKCR
jgi:CRISPR-associated protein Csm1